MGAKADDALTQKQEAFCVAYIETGNAAEAYRRAYDVKALTSHSTIYVAASELMRNPKIKVRVQQLQDQAAELCLYSVKQAFQEYEDARKLASDEKNPSAVVAAVNGKVKLFGLDNHKQAIEHTGKNGGPIQHEQKTDLSKLTDEQLADLGNILALASGSAEGA